MDHLGQIVSNHNNFTLLHLENLHDFIKKKANDMSNELNEDITPGNIYVVPSAFSVSFRN
jgi:hypothetical protein